MSQPKEIAKILFSENLKNTNSICLDLEEFDFEYVFQILINIFIEGLLIKKFVYFENNELVINMESSNIFIMNQYMNSIKIKSYVEISEFDNNEFQNRYCTVKILNKENNNIEFLINPLFYQKFYNNLNLETFKSKIKFGEQMITIYFSFN
jgi:hypothetical protein